VRPVSYACALSRLASVHAESHAGPGELHHAFHRRLDDSIPADHADGHAAAVALESAGAGALPPDGRAICFLLRMSSFLDLDRARQIFRLARDGSGHFEAALHHCWNAGAAAAAAAGDYVHIGVGPAAWFQEMATAASACLFRGARWRDSLLLAG